MTKKINIKTCKLSNFSHAVFQRHEFFAAVSLANIVPFPDAGSVSEQLLIALLQFVGKLPQRLSCFGEGGRVGGYFIRHLQIVCFESIKLCKKINK